MELVFNTDHEHIKNPDYENEAAELMKRYDAIVNKTKVQELNDKLKELDEDSDAYEDTLRQILDLQNTLK